MAYSPFETISEYPIDGNNLKINEDGTHVFWPTFQKLYSKFYMKLVNENQTFFGFSQQVFFVQRNNDLYPQTNTTMTANDHLAFVKAEGNWRDHYSDTTPVGESGLEFESDDISFSTTQWALMSGRLMNLLLWLHSAKFGSLLREQGILPSQIPHIKNKPYTNESVDFGARLQRDMEKFSAGITHDHYHNFEKSAMMCLHIDTDGIAPTKTGDVEGWWLPLKHNFLAWRSMNLQEPMSKNMVTFGSVSMDLDEHKKTLKVVFRGRQFFRADVEDIHFTNMRLDVGPPNDIPDTRPPPLEKPGWIVSATIGKLLEFNSPNKLLPWAPREQLCPSNDFKANFDKFKGACPDADSLSSPTCVYRFSKIYPCFNYLLRSSKKFSHGIDGTVEFLTVLHLVSEADWDFIEMAAMEKPWDEEFEEAIAMFGLEPTA